MNPETDSTRRTASAPPSWLSSLARSQPALANWAESLGAAAAAGTPSIELRRIAGKGLVIEDADHADVDYELEEIAAGLDIPLVRIDAGRLDEFLQGAEIVDQPTIVSLCFGPSIAKNDNDSASLDARRRLMATLDNPHDRRVFVTCVDDFLDIATPLRRAGRFDAYLQWDEPTPESSVQDFIDATAGVRIESEVVRDLKRLGHFLCMRFPGRRLMGLLAIAMRRLSYRTDRPIRMRDLMEFAANGTRMHSNPRKPRDEMKIAVHEAGHALANIVASGWSRTPDFVSIVPTHSYLGVMIESFCDIHRSRQQVTVNEVLLQIKTKLGGRAAEVIVFGSESVSAFGAEEDLSDARALAQRLVASAGVIIEDGQIRQRPWTVPEKTDEREAAELTVAVHALLEVCWCEVIAMMSDHRGLLLRLTEALADRKHLLREDICAVLGGTWQPGGIENSLGWCPGSQGQSEVRMRVFSSTQHVSEERSCEKKIPSNDLKNELHGTS